MYLLQTERLGLRNWQHSDMDVFAEMNADKEVMAFFPNMLSNEESLASAERFMEHFEKYGFTYFASETISDQQFIGFIGLMHQTYESPFTPCVDIGWRLRRTAWGKGFATEGAGACLNFAFSKIGLQEVIAVAPKLNVRSENVMQKIGMVKVGEFNHPKIKETSPLAICNVYKREGGQLITA